MKNDAGKTKLYWFNWPSHVGGADTKFAHLLPLLAVEYDITAVPNGKHYLDKKEWCTFLDAHGVRTALFEELPKKLEGWAVSLCNSSFFKTGIAEDMKRRGANVAWSNEMMWHFEGELEAVRSGIVDHVMYVSPVQRAALEPGYRQAAGGGAAATGEDGLWGEIPRENGVPLPWTMTGNWINPNLFLFRLRSEKEGNAPFTVGRLSRPDPDKFPDNFPSFFEGLGLREPVRFRVMGWSEQLLERWCEHEFDARWNLLPPASEPVTDFLNSLDILVYDLSPRFRESWGRAIVEAMLCGVVPIVPRGGGHHVEKLVKHGVSGFLCSSQNDFGVYARALQNDSVLLQRLSAGARRDACDRHCHAVSHLALWRRIFG